MPYNFEGTFTQPLLLKLDNGTITGASDWADAITTGYIDTIKAGLSQNTPPTLPAPGLNPTSAQDRPQKPGCARAIAIAKGLGAKKKGVPCC